MYPTVVFGTYGQEKETYTTRILPLGTELILNDGRRFRFALNGASAGAQGKVAQQGALTANHVGLSVAAAASVGDTTVQVTLGATALTEDQYRDGYLVIEDAAGQGAVYSITKHAAVASAGTFTVPLNQTVIKALTTSSKASLVKNPYDGVIIHPSPPTLALVGAWQTDLAAATYGWLQTKGLASLLTDGTVVVGKMCVASASVDGAVSPAALTEGTPNTGYDAQVVGRVVRVLADTKYSHVDMTL